MSEQRKTEWLEVSNDYHEKQFAEPYRSTVAFCDWLQRLGLLRGSEKGRLLDVGAGQGANLYYMARRFPDIDLTGIDLNASLVQAGNDIFERSGVANARLRTEDLYRLDANKYHGQFEGIVSYQTLSWLPDYEEPLRVMAGLNPKWIALTSLFFDGDVSCRIETKDYTAPIGGKLYKEAFYNIYSLRQVKEHLAKLGYTAFHVIPFEIDVDLAKPKTTGMGTYTEKLADGRRLQISGPLLMSWHFIAAVKEN